MEIRGIRALNSLKEEDYLLVTKLDLSWYKLQEIPDFIGNLTNLTHLDLSANQLQEIPDIIGTLTNLTHLSLSNNQLREIPLT